jgi:hypothetical protein
MGEARRKKEAGYEEHKDRMHLLKHNMPNIRGYYREALAGGMDRPIMVLGDTRNEYVAQLVEIAGKKNFERMNDLLDAGMIPTALVALPYGETTFQAFGATAPNGAHNVKLITTYPGIPVVVIAGHGNTYASVALED